MSVQQISALIEFLEGQPELALGRGSRSKEGRSQSKRLWELCARILNGVSSDGVRKTAEQWRMFYNEYKHRLLKKMKVEKEENLASGDGPPKTIKLTALQKRLYSILSRNGTEPIKTKTKPEVRHDPLSQYENEAGTSSWSVEQMSAQATLEHAQATNRLAAAIESLSERLSQPIQINIVGQPRTAPRKRCRPGSDSDSSDGE